MPFIYDIVYTGENEAKGSKLSQSEPLESGYSPGVLLHVGSYKTRLITTYDCCLTICR